MRNPRNVVPDKQIDKERAMRMHVVSMPPAGKLMEQLVEVNDDSDLQEKFYPAICEYATGRQNGPSIIQSVELAIYDYANKNPVVTAALEAQVEEFVRAITPPKILEETLEFLRQNTADAGDTKQDTKDD